jgi:hypothetical protein
LPERRPEPGARPGPNYLLYFDSEDDFRVWGREHGPVGEQFVQDALTGHAELMAWQAAGNTGSPPGWTSMDDYLRELAL